jgi:hypothetical protein
MPKIVLTLMLITLITLAILFYYSYSSYLHDFHEGVPTIDNTRNGLKGGGKCPSQWEVQSNEY